MSDDKPVEPIKKNAATHFFWKNEVMLNFFFLRNNTIFKEIFLGQNIKQVFHLI